MTTIQTNMVYHVIRFCSHITQMYANKKNSNTYKQPLGLDTFLNKSHFLIFSVHGCAAELYSKVPTMM